MKTTLSLAAALLIGTAGMAVAQSEGTTSTPTAEAPTTTTSAFGLQQTQEANALVELGTVTAQADGVIEIYDITDTELTTVLGTQPVTAGANNDVRVTLNQEPVADLLAILKIDGVEVARTEIDIAE